MDHGILMCRRELVSKINLIFVVLKLFVCPRKKFFKATILTGKQIFGQARLCVC